MLLRPKFVSVTYGANSVDRDRMHSIIKVLNNRIRQVNLQREDLTASVIFCHHLGSRGAFRSLRVMIYISTWDWGCYRRVKRGYGCY